MTLTNAIEAARAEVAAIDPSTDAGFIAARRAIEAVNDALLAQARANVARDAFIAETGAAPEMLVDDPVNRAVAVFGSGALIIFRCVDERAEILACFPRS